MPVFCDSSLLCVGAGGRAGRGEGCSLPSSIPGIARLDSGGLLSVICDARRKHCNAQAGHREGLGPRSSTARVSMNCAAIEGVQCV